MDFDLTKFSFDTGNGSYLLHGSVTTSADGAIFNSHHALNLLYSSLTLSLKDGKFFGLVSDGSTFLILASEESIQDVFIISVDFLSQGR